MILSLYRWALLLLTPALIGLLHFRASKGKEEPERLPERMGKPGKPRPDGNLLWVHAASVGEAQSALIVIEEMISHYPRLSILVTTGTKTSATLMEDKLPKQAFHQFMPLDHPGWARRFMDYWRPDLVFWMESELWPNMLGEIKARRIPAALLNARLSAKSYSNWSKVKDTARAILSTFDVILCQNAQEEAYFKSLGAPYVHTTGNIKYSAAPLAFDKDKLAELQKQIGTQKIWLFASTHDGEEEMAARIHTKLAEKHKKLLTVIVPRHPERGAAIQNNLIPKSARRSLGEPIDKSINIYIADTLGELGLFYRLSPIAVIGRSFSRDGGGGHNPIESAHLDCAVLHGPNVQNLQEIYDEMSMANAATQSNSEEALCNALDTLLSDKKALKTAQENARDFCESKDQILQRLYSYLEPVIHKVL